jgi:hypothetical protein
MSLKQQIIEWNLARNSLHFDPILEAKMLSEEANEFFTAPNLVERIREFSDFQFVLIGTKAKFFARKYENHSEVTYSYEHFKDLMEWAEEAYFTMEGILTEELGRDKSFDIFDKALECVLKANQAKGIEKDTDGKVVKGDTYKSPSEAIEELLSEHSSN